MTDPLNSGSSDPAGPWYVPGRSAVCAARRAPPSSLTLPVPQTRPRSHEELKHRRSTWRSCKIARSRTHAGRERHDRAAQSSRGTESGSRPLTADKWPTESRRAPLWRPLHSQWARPERYAAPLRCSASRPLNLLTKAQLRHIQPETCTDLTRQLIWPWSAAKLALRAALTNGHS